MIRILSPHLDDAVLSLGQFMATTPCEVITVFAGIPPADMVSDYDQASGWTSSREAMYHRRDEDRNALSVLRCKARHLSYLDHQYVGGDIPDVGARELRDALVRYFDDETHTFAPLGLGHPDHRLLTHFALCACEDARTVEGHEVLLYEELPYRVLNPEEVPRQLDEVRKCGFTIDEITWPFPVSPTRETLERKRLAISKYASQFPDGAEDPCLLVPERVWRCTK